MNPTPDDLLARRIAAHLGEQPEVSAHVAHRLVAARTRAVAQFRAQQEPTRVGALLALRGLVQTRARLAMGLATLLVAGLCATIANHDSNFVVDPWHADDDSSHYVDLLQD